jgi:hypothetical protein
MEPAPEGDPGFFNWTTYHDTKLDAGLMKIQVYSERMSNVRRSGNGINAAVFQAGCCRLAGTR